MRIQALRSRLAKGRVYANDGVSRKTTSMSE